MPYIDSKVTVALSEKDKELLKKHLGKIVDDIPGKSEKFLMIGFQDEYSLYFKGQKLDYGAFVEVKLFGGVSEDSLKKVIKDISKLYSDKLNIPQNAIYVKFEEVDTWGWNGKTL